MPSSAFHDGSTSEQIRIQAAWSVTLAHALIATGWFAHQHPVDVVRCEVESIPFPGHVPQDISSRLSSLSLRLSQAVAFLPQPSLRSHTSSAVPSSARGIRLPLPKVPIPLERTLSRSDPRTSPLLWRAIVLEVASGWATFTEPSALGLLFIGPKERLCYWPRWLNQYLLDIPVSYGQVWDLFMVLAMFGLKLDLKSAFRSVEVDPAETPLLGAVLDSFPVTFLRLPFGMKSSPVVFVAILARTLSAYGASMPSTTSALSSFVDDIATGSTSLDAFVLSAEHLVNSLLSDGWWIALSKTFLFPAVRLLYIGFVIDFGTTSVRIAPSKRQKFLTLLCSIPVPTRESLPVEPSINAVAPRSLRIAASSTGVSVLHLDQVSTPPTLPRLPIIAGSISTPLPTTWPTHSVFQSVDSLVQHLSLVGLPPPSATHSSPPIVAVVCSLSAASDVISCLPPLVVARCAVILMTVGPPRGPPPTSWIESALSDLSPPTAARIAARIPQLDPTPLPPQPVSPTPSLSPESWANLRRLLGILAWFQSVFRWLGYLREPLDRTLNSSVWTPASCNAIFSLRDIFARCDGLSSPAKRPSSPLLIVVDSAKAWGAVIPSATHPPVFCAGPIPMEVQGASSTVKETWGARRATCRALEIQQAAFDGVNVTVDSTALIGAAEGGSSVEAINDALSFFAVLAMAGIPVSWQWERRSDGWHPTSDALSATPQPWPLKPAVHLIVESAFGRASFAIGSSAVPPYMGSSFRYATLRCGHAERDLILDGVNPTSSVGWMGPISSSLSIPLSEVAFCHPLWSQIPDLWEVWAARPFNLILIAPTIPALFWAPALGRFKEAATSSITLPPDSLQPPEQNRSLSAPDPRQLSAYQLSGSQERSPRVQRSIGGSRGGTEAFARCSPNALNPGPRSHRHDPWKDSAAAIPPRSTNTSPSSSGSLPSSLSVAHNYNVPPHRRDPWAGSVAQLPQCADPHPVATLPPFRIPTARDPHRIPLPSLCHMVTPLIQPPDPSPPNARITLGQWVIAMGRSMVDGSVVHDQVDHRIQTLISESAGPPSGGSSRPARVTRYVGSVISEYLLTELPATLPNIQGVLVLYINLRLQPLPPFGWEVVNVPAVVAADISAITALSSRTGIPIPPCGGPSVRSILERWKAFDKPDHSKAFPLPLDLLIAARPPSNAAHTIIEAWESLIIMSFFCLRSGVLPHLTREMFIPYAGGWLLLWRHAHKRAASSPVDPLFLSSSPMLSAARNPLLSEILSKRPPGPLFSKLSHASLTSFIRSSIPNVHQSFDIRAYGARVAAVQDSSELGVPSTLARSLFWWKQGEISMAEYYAGTNVMKMLIFSEARLLIQHSPLTPGYFAATISAPSPSWGPIIGPPPPPLPKPSPAGDLSLAWNATSESFISKRMKTIQSMRDKARAMLERTFPCARCKVTIGLTQPAYLCDVEGCPWGVCPDCHPQGSDGHLWCPSHSP